MKAPKCKYPEFNTEMDLGEYEKPDIGIEDHGSMMLFGGFDYKCGNQGLGYIVDIGFLESFIKVFGVDTLREVNGKFAWVEHNRGKIFRILSVDGKREFDIEKYCKEEKQMQSEPPMEIVTIEETIVTTQEGPKEEPKKKRGRPKKEAVSKQNIITETNPLYRDLGKPTQKKRGRPKKKPGTKSEIIKKVAEEKNIPVTNIPVEKKKRGRPKKTEPVSTDPVPIEQVEKKKRGRPKKEDNIIGTFGNGGGEDKLEPTKKKRGRPRKTKENKE